jgi:hypothetical protein
VSITKYYKHKGDIDEIAHRYPAFFKLKNVKIERVLNKKWRNIDNGSISYQELAVFIGKTGYGKSSTINAFFGSSIMKTSDVVACTRECQCLDFKLSSDSYFSLGDLPGIGESEYRDKEYLKMYKDFLRISTVVVYVIRADTRDYSIDELAYKQLFTTLKDKKKVLFALNYCDKIEPINRGTDVEPSLVQMQNILEKVASVGKIFQPHNEVIPYSAATGWNMNKLADSIVNTLLVAKN